MKRITRLVAFSAAGLYMTSILVGGFEVSKNLETFGVAVLVLGAFHYIIAPLMRVLLLPLNLLTLGLFSTAVYIIVFNYLVARLKLVSVTEWVYEGYSSGSVSVPRMELGIFATLVVSALIYSGIINLLERLL